ncbi:hypothetical protein F5141DRAFT_1066413 [Pisolithus sp. B1]|nr:hypothetical protein F5141DRAFT_1066413 [Pisolithus sp. B1]
MLLSALFLVFCSAHSVDVEACAAPSPLENKMIRFREGYPDCGITFYTNRPAFLYFLVTMSLVGKALDPGHMISRGCAYKFSHRTPGRRTFLPLVHRVSEDTTERGGAPHAVISLQTLGASKITLLQSHDTVAGKFSLWFANPRNSLDGRWSSSSVDKPIELAFLCPYGHMSSA